MHIINQSWSYIERPNGEIILDKLEVPIRLCYKSESGTKEQRNLLLKKIIDSGHESVLEHISISVLVKTDRATSMEIIRHRIGFSFSQTSQRYINYTKKEGFEFILPTLFANIDNENDIKKEAYLNWVEHCQDSEKKYKKLILDGVSPQFARSVLPNSMATEMYITANLRAWRHFFKLRTSTKAHPQIREIALSMMDQFKQDVPIIFDDIN